MRKILTIAGSTLAAVAILSTVAVAQTAPAVVYVEQPTSWLSVATTIAIALIPIVGAILIPIIRTHYGEANAKLAEEIINAIQNRLQAAVGRAAGLAINDLGTRAVNEIISVADPAVTKGVDYLRDTMADTLRELGLNTTKGESTLRKMIVAQIGQQVAGSLGAAASTPDVVVVGDGGAGAQSGRK